MVYENNCTQVKNLPLALILGLITVLISCSKSKDVPNLTPPEKIGDIEDLGIIKFIGELHYNKIDSIATTPLITPTYDGSGQTTHPSVLYFPKAWNGYKFWMAHSPYPFSNEFNENPSIIASNDGVNWVEPYNISNPLDMVSFEESKRFFHYSDPALVFNNHTNEIECWYRFSKTGKVEQIFRRKTKDGRTWTKREKVLDQSKNKPIDMILSPSIVYENGEYKMWSVSLKPNRVEFRTSKDAVRWSKPETQYIKLPDNILPWHIEVKLIDNEFLMLLNCLNASKKDINTKFLMSSSSKDGANWDDFSYSILPNKDPNKWNGKMIYKSSFIKIKGTYVVYYASMSKDYKWHLGVAYGNSLNSLKYY